ncbi:MAG: hypothetical protein ABW193_08900, partial [Luteibacter sp.]
LIPRSAMPEDLKLPMFALFLLLSVIFAWLMARFVGTPLNRWLRIRFAPMAIDQHTNAPDPALPR